MKHYIMPTFEKKPALRNHTARRNKLPKDQQRKDGCQRYHGTKRFCSENIA